jgi:sulfite exporter TauE/SafE
VIALLGAVIAASVVGSLHCVVMCGPLVAVHHGAPRGQVAPLVALHHGGRLLAYVGLGIGAGALGGAIELAGELASVQRAAMIVAGVALVGWGVVLVARSLGVLGTAAEPAPARGRVFDVAVGALRRQAPRRRAALFGAITGLLPCGWLWAFVVTAAGTASWWQGGLVMGVFWAGTLPALVGATALLGPVLGGLRARWPVVTGLVLIGLGATALLVRMPLLTQAPSKTPSCHAHGGHAAGMAP